MPFDPRRTCRKNTGPRDSSLMQSATAANSGARNEQAEGCGDEVERPLEDPRRAREPHRPEPHERDSLERVHLGSAAEDLEVPRDDVDLHVEVADRADVGEHGLVRVVREGEDHALDPVLADAFAKAVRAAEQQREPLCELVVELGRTIVDEAHEVDAVLAMVRQLESELLADVSRADDHRVLLVAGQMAAERPRDCAQCRDQDDGGEPEDAEPAEHRLHEVRGDAEESEDPDADRDAAEDADDVVDGGVVGPLLVAVVEPLEPKQEKPARDREQECDVLETRGDPVAGRAARDERTRENEREDESHDVRGEQHRRTRAPRR